MIVHVFNSSIVSGPETLVIPALASLSEPVTVVFLYETRKGEASNKPVRYAESLGLATRVVPVRSRVDGQAVARLRETLRELGTKVAHSHDVKASTYLLRAAGPRSAREYPIVSTHHGVRGRSGWVSKAYEAFYTRLILPRFDRVLTVCASDRELLVARGLRPDRVETHLNGVDRRKIDAGERGAERARLHADWGLAARGIPSGSVVLGFAGRIAGEKRLDRVLQVMAHLKSLHRGLPRWDLVIFGTGPLEADYHAATRAMGLESQVHWMGYRAGLGSEMAGFDLLLSLSDAEGLPINLVEAGWAGTPVLATGVDGNRDLFPSAEYGLTVAVEESDEAIATRLAELLADPERRRSLGRMFQGRVEERFSGSRWTAELRRIYSDLAHRVTMEASHHA
ncbi:MAG: glycosyltransferase family 4 protein [Bdellovibrionales bacterium]|nr:glycosyltransferase family 4 protein [Bdellovibrionales bacterium]